MRALIVEPELSEAAYRRFVRRAQLEGLLVDHLVAGEPYLSCNALLLRQEEAELLVRLTSVFSRAFLKAASVLFQDVPRLIELGFPWVAAELLAAESPRNPLLGRFDFARDVRGHWWLLEFNADTPSGIREAIVADRLVHRLRAGEADQLRPNERLAPMLVQAFGREMEGTRGRLGLATDASELEDLAQMAYTQRLLAGPLRDSGVEVVLGDVDNLDSGRDGLRLVGLRIDALYRYLPFEGIFGHRSFTAIFDAVERGKLRLLNGLFGLLQQHKGLLAWIWERRNDSLFDHEERAAIADHLPPTWLLAQAPRDITIDSLVLKQVFGREGEEVFFGSDLPPQVLEELRARRTYVAQSRVEVCPLIAEVPTAGGFEARSGFATVGCYAVHGTWAGFYSRFGGKIITSRARWLATFAERGR